MKMHVILVATTVCTAGVLAVAPSASADAGCPPGWELQAVPPGDSYDKNNDGYICTKYLEDGKGNSANSQRGDGQDGFHVDGHNHKDNNTPPRS